MRSNNKHLCLLAVAVCLTACANSEQRQAQELLEQARFAQAHSRYGETLCLVDSLRRTCPKAIEERRAALKLHQEASLLQAQEEAEQLARQLQAADAEYRQMLKAVETGYLPEYQADDANRLTQLRLRRDSLRVRYDTQTAKMEYIRRRQKQ